MANKLGTKITVTTTITYDARGNEVAREQSAPKIRPVRIPHNPAMGEQCPCESCVMASARKDDCDWI